MNIVKILTSFDNTDNDEMFEIGELASELSISTRTIRFYEEKGIVTPERRGNNRVFTKKDRARLILALRGKRLGFTLDEVKKYLDLYKIEEDGSNKKQYDYLIAKIDTAVGDLLEKKEEIELTIVELGEMKEMAENLKKR